METQAQKITLEQVTPKQREAIECLMSEMLKDKDYARDENGEHKYEFKRQELFSFNPDRPGLVFFNVEIGMKGDEGTMARHMCRDAVHVMVKPTGGMVLMSKTQGLNFASYSDRNTMKPRDIARWFVKPRKTT